MTDFEIVEFPFDQKSLVDWSFTNEIARDWPVVYILNNDKEVYVGETINAQSRLQQHLTTESKKNLKRVQIVLSSKFNKSACLDLESQLIQYLAADGAHRVLNANAGIVNGNYFDREEYRATFQSLFDRLVENGLLTRPIPEIINSNLFKYSPFKSLTADQAIAVKGILDEILQGKRKGKTAKIVV
jgi:predicted GIY-YIG superfamily endonuclease